MDLPVDHRGFILQASYRIRAGIPVVHLYGRLNDGRTFLVRDGRQRPRFYVRAADAARARSQAALTVLDTGLSTMDGEAVCRVEVAVPSDAPPARQALERLGIEAFEADVRFAVRYLIDRDVQGACVDPRRG